MTYIDLLNSYWAHNSRKSFPIGEGLLYLLLLDACNKKYWSNPFTVSTSHLAYMLQYTPVNIRKLRAKLKKRGLIDFVKAKGTGEAIYLIREADITNEELIKKFGADVNIPHTQSEVSSVVSSKVSTKVSSEVSSEVSSNPNSTLLYKDNKTIKTKDNVDDDVCENAKAVFPELEEVKEYFKSTASDKLEDWELSAELFFHTFNADGWLDKYGRTIKNWRGKADRWIFYGIQREKKGSNTRSRRGRDRDYRTAYNHAAKKEIAPAPDREVFGAPL